MRRSTVCGRAVALAGEGGGGANSFSQRPTSARSGCSCHPAQAGARCPFHCVLVCCCDVCAPSPLLGLPLQDAAALNSDIQSELQAYMDEHDLNRMFAGMVEAVLMEQPRRPQAFLVSYLIKNFGDKIDLEALGLRRTAGNPASSSAGGRAAAAGVAGGPTGTSATAAAAAAKAAPADEGSDDDDSDDSDDNDDDVVDELPAFRSTRGTSRRESVSAEASVDPRVLKAQWAAERKVFPKSDNDRRRLRAILLDNILFQRLDDEQLDIVLDALSPVTFKDGKTIIKQGDAGDLFYVVESGTPEVYVDARGTSTKVRTVVPYPRARLFTCRTVCCRAGGGVGCFAQVCAMGAGGGGGSYAALVCRGRGEWTDPLPRRRRPARLPLLPCTTLLRASVTTG